MTVLEQINIHNQEDLLFIHEVNKQPLCLSVVIRNVEGSCAMYHQTLVKFPSARQFYVDCDQTATQAEVLLMIDMIVAHVVHTDAYVEGLMQFGFLPAIILHELHIISRVSLVIHFNGHLLNENCIEIPCGQNRRCQLVFPM